MTEEHNDAAWLKLIIRDTYGVGVEATRLAKLLESLSGTFLAIARDKIGTSSNKRGRRTSEEERLSGVRVVKVEPGSTSIELAPPAEAVQRMLGFSSAATVDDVALEFYEGIVRIAEGRRVPPDRRAIDRRVRNLLRAANEIGHRTEVVFRPLTKGPSFPAEDELRAEILTENLKSSPQVSTGVRVRRISGHAYMVDVEPGHERVRVKLPDNRDLTLDVDEPLAPRLRGALDEVLQLEVEEQVEGDAVTGRRVQDFSILLPAQVPSGEPPKSVDELAKDQGLPRVRPNYVALASEVWRTADELGEFEEYVRDLRAKSLT